MYFKMLDWGCTPEEARAVLPNSLKTELVMTANIRRSNTMAKADISKVIPSLARQALKLAGGDRKAAYSRYIQLYFRQTGRLAPGCNNKDLQAFYEKECDNDA